MVESHGFGLWAADSQLNCLTLGCKSSQCTLAVLTWWSQYDHIIYTKAETQSCGSQNAPPRPLAESRNAAHDYNGFNGLQPGQPGCHQDPNEHWPSWSSPQDESRDRFVFSRSKKHMWTGFVNSHEPPQAPGREWVAGPVSRGPDETQIVPPEYELYPPPVPWVDFTGEDEEYVHPYNWSMASSVLLSGKNPKI